MPNKLTVVCQQHLVSMALESMLYEVSVNPKPGLVDPIDNGTHPDMNVFMFIDSALSLRPYFEQCVAAALQFNNVDLTKLFDAIRPAGIEAERVMFKATNGVNTHKGAIFSLGILLTATAYQLKQGGSRLSALSKLIQKMLANLIDHDFNRSGLTSSHHLTAGERQFIKYGFLGIRGEAAAGFPTVFEHAYPFLKERSGSINQRLLDTLLKIVQFADDSNLIKRSGDPNILNQVRRQVQRYFDLGGSQTIDGYQKLLALNQTFKQQHLSLGGSADLLILTIFLGIKENTVNSTHNIV